MTFTTPTLGHCDCGRPSACWATGWCGYCAGRPAMVAAKATITAPATTLRDEFAIAALAVTPEGWCADLRAKEAFKIADAMMKARGSTRGETLAAIKAGDTATIGDRVYTAKKACTGIGDDWSVSCSFRSATHYGDAGIAAAEFLQHRDNSHAARDCE